jgi:hypothetical protein
VYWAYVSALIGFLVSFVWFYGLETQHEGVVASKPSDVTRTCFFKTCVETSVNYLQLEDGTVLLVGTSDWKIKGLNVGDTVTYSQLGNALQVGDTFLKLPELFEISAGH